MEPELSPDLVLYAYQQGIFPMADPECDNQVFWFRPEERGVIPLDAFHVPTNLAKLVRRGTFRVTADRAFGDVIRACADRAETWISPEIIAVYEALHTYGFAHSVECWLDDELVGGLYGVALGGAFFGESMFHRRRDASKVALVHLVRRMRRGGFVLLDTQYVTPHLEQFGAQAVDRLDYERYLDAALAVDASWPAEAAEDAALPSDDSHTPS